LLDTGGFEWNAPLTSACVPGIHAHPQTPPTADGDGHTMAGELGAAFSLMDQTTLIPAIRVPGEDNAGEPLYRLFFQELARPHSLVVNRAGERFANESFFPDIARGWSQHDDDRADWPNVPMYFIFDDQYRRAGGLPGSLEVGTCLTSHPDLTSLAHARTIDAQGLHDQVSRLNEDAAAGVDRAFHRGATAYQRAFAGTPAAGENPTIGTVAVPPYYSVELFPSTSGHRGGVVTDGAARVLDVRGAPMPGLYACGSAAAGLVTGAGYLSGASLGAAIAFGVLAADAMLRASPGDQDRE
jgi:3-oxosteroid 1-dehydrogenase